MNATAYLEIRAIFPGSVAWHRAEIRRLSVECAAELDPYRFRALAMTRRAVVLSLVGIAWSN